MTPLKLRRNHIENGSIEEKVIKYIKKKSLKKKNGFLLPHQISHNKSNIKNKIHNFNIMYKFIKTKNFLQTKKLSFHNKKIYHIKVKILKP